MVQALTKHWLNKPHRSRRLCFSIYAQHCPSFAMPTYKENIFAYNEIYTLAALTDIATIVHNNGMRRIAYSLNIGIIWLCRTVLRILFSKLGERINIHYAVIRWAVRTDCLHGAYQWGKVQWENKNWKSSRQHTFGRTKSFTRHRSCSVWMEISLPVPLNRESRIWKSTPHRRFPTRKSSRWSICRSLCGGSYPRCRPLLSE